VRQYTSGEVIEMGEKRSYRVGEFATLTGVSIRTLHHYESIGLLHPRKRTEAGYRLYFDEDLLTLQQILTLRYLGFGLTQIRELLRRPSFDLVASLDIQRGVIRERIAELQRIDASLSVLLDQRLATGQWNWDLARAASNAVQSGLKQKGEAMTDYYSPEEIRQHAAELATELPPNTLQDAEREWRALLAEVHANLHLPPESPKARELATRWEELHERIRPYFQNREKLWNSLGRAHRDGVYDHLPNAGHAEDYAFIRRVQEATAR
jgi:DNA-binding transcriptional MerR regulator